MFPIPHIPEKKYHKVVRYQPANATNIYYQIECDDEEKGGELIVGEKPLFCPMCGKRVKSDP